jgi:hypothetical protein
MTMLFKRMLMAMTAQLKLITAEAENGITAIEAEKMAERREQLRALFPHPDDRAAALDNAIALAQMGVNGYEETQRMATFYIKAKARGITARDFELLDEIKRGN